MTDDSPPILTSDLAFWRVILNGGETVTLRAHAFAEIEGAYVFVALMEGVPHYEYELARIPAPAVRDVEGGWGEPPALGS